MSNFDIKEAGVLEIPLSKTQQMSLFDWICNGSEDECPVKTKWPETMPSPPKKGDVFFVFMGTRSAGDELVLQFSRRVVENSPYESTKLSDPYRDLEPEEEAFLKRILNYAKKTHNVVLSSRVLRRIIDEESSMSSTASVIHATDVDRVFDRVIDDLERIGVFKTTIFQGKSS